MNIQTNLTSHNKWYLKILLNIRIWSELGFKIGDKVKITKLEDGKVLVEKKGDDENV